MIQKFIDLPITICTVLLLSVSILVIYSSSSTLALGQFIFAIVGMILYFLVSQIDYRTTAGLVKGAYFLVLALLFLVFIIGFETRGSIRWIPLGIFNIQPSEFGKPMMIIFLANFWAGKLTSWINILKSVLILFPIIILVFKQPDLGTTLTIGAIWLGMLFSTKISYKKILTIILFIAVLIPMLWLTLHDYQRSRITSFLSPQSDPLGMGYNLIQSTIAVGSGEFIGRGLGYGTQSRLQFLPEFRTDFIFATIAEEFGFIGSVLILFLYIFMISYCLKVSGQADYRGSLIASGVAIMLLFQTAVNIGMNIGLLPITGITLPLISYGGSSLISTLISLGLVASVAKSRKTKLES